VASGAIYGRVQETGRARVVPGDAPVSPYVVKELQKLLATFHSPTTRRHSSIRLSIHPLIPSVAFFLQTLDMTNLQFKIPQNCQF